MDRLHSVQMTNAHDTVQNLSDVTYRGGYVFGAINIHGNGQVHLGDNYKAEAVALSASEANYVKLRDSLWFEHFDTRLHNVKKPLSKTCEWLFEHPQFKVWESRSNMEVHNGFLWIKGKPGCGKSTIMKTLFERTKRSSYENDGHPAIIHYFFNARAISSLERSTLGCLRSLVYQLLLACPSARPIFEEKFGLKTREGLDVAWTQQELQDFLLDLTTTNVFVSMCIFIDALDEGELEDDVRQLIDLLVDLSESALDFSVTTCIRICLSSRHYPHIGIKKGLSLNIEDQPEHAEDIRTYVRRKINAPIVDDDEDLGIAICRKSKHVFLWVVLVVNILNKSFDRGRSLAELRRTLDTMPADLGELFSRILVTDAP